MRCEESGLRGRARERVLSGQGKRDVMAEKGGELEVRV